MNVARSSSATATTGTAESTQGYCGRFAPSPTGPLHFGSLVAAVGSYLEARSRGGRWLLRIEDLDPPRERPGAADRILTDLERFGFRWDGPVLRQSARAPAYAAALDRLAGLGLTMACSCSRSELAALRPAERDTATEDLRHPPACIRPATRGAAATRFRCAQRVVEFNDRCQGQVSDNVASSVGPFVLRRRDGQYSYQLAVTVDDAEQGVTDVVRGADLLHSTCRQLLLQEALDLPQPGYLHLPLAVDTDGNKLSKSGDAPGLDGAEPSEQLIAALRFLRQAPPVGLQRAQPAEIWSWALGCWRPERFRSLIRINVNAARHDAAAQEPDDDQQA